MRVEFLHLLLLVLLALLLLQLLGLFFVLLLHALVVFDEGHTFYFAFVLGLVDELALACLLPFQESSTCFVVQERVEGLRNDVLDLEGHLAVDEFVCPLERVVHSLNGECSCSKLVVDACDLLGVDLQVDFLLMNGLDLNVVRGGQAGDCVLQVLDDVDAIGVGH